MRKKFQKEAKKRERLFLLFTYSKIVAEITMIIGVFVFIWFVLRRWV
jgi:hypothetical protein